MFALPFYYGLGYTPLYVAADVDTNFEPRNLNEYQDSEANQNECLQILLDPELNPHRHTLNVNQLVNGFSVLFHACSRANGPLVELLLGLPDIDVNARGKKLQEHPQKTTLETKIVHVFDTKFWFLYFFN